MDNSCITCARAVGMWMQDCGGCFPHVKILSSSGQPVLHARTMVKKREDWGMVYYFVQKGESLFTIAMRYQTTVHAIVTANRLKDPNGITPGQALIIPRPGEVPVPVPGGIVHLVRAGETIFDLAARFKTTPQEILRANQVAHPEFILPGQQLVIPERMEAGEEWPTWGRNPARTAAAPAAPKGQPVRGWSYMPRESCGYRPSAPVVRYGKVYTGLGDGCFYALERSNGRIRWRVPGGGQDAGEGPARTAMAAPLVFDGLVYLCGLDGVIRAVDAHAGSTVWRVAADGSFTGSPGIWNGIIYAASTGGHVYALEAKTGAQVWERQLDGSVTGPVSTGDARLFIVSDKGELTALDGETGEALWRAPADPKAHPVYADVLVLVGGRAYDPLDGSLLWEVDTGGTSPVVWMDQVILPWGVLDLFTGTPKGSWFGSGADSALAGDGAFQPLPSPNPPLLHCISAGRLLIGLAGDGKICACEVGSGRPVWMVDLEGESHHPPALVGGQLFVTLDHGAIRTYRLA